MARFVVFSHGKESGPWGTKIVALAEVARARGWDVASVDYRGIDDPAQRVDALLGAGAAVADRPLLVGSSMGGHVATAASVPLRARGLFLLAPAFYMPGYEHLTPLPVAAPVAVVHGWHDEVVPVEHSIRWAREQRATLHLLDSDHRLQDQLDVVSRLFGDFLATAMRAEG